MLNVMVCGLPTTAVVSALATVIAWRNDPGPESAVLATTDVPPALTRLGSVATNANVAQRARLLSSSARRLEKIVTRNLGASVKSGCFGTAIYHYICFNYYTIYLNRRASFPHYAKQYGWGTL
jgi:hypothetical protein